MVKPRHLCVGGMAFLVLVGLLAFGCDSGKTSRNSPSTAQVPAPPPPPASTAPASGWQPDPAALDKLEPYLDLKRYQIRVPKGWSLTPEDDSSSAKHSEILFFRWHGPQRSDGTRPELHVTAAPMPPSPNEAAAGKTAADALFDEFLQARTKDIVSCTDKQSGQLDGMWFGRANLREHIATGADIRGVMYVGRDGSAVIVLRSFDAPSHLQESEKLGAAAVLTFRKKR